MKTTSLMLVFSSLILISACGKSHSSANSSPPPTSQRVESLEKSEWIVVKKSCQGRNLIRTQGERVHLDNGMFAFIHEVSADQNSICTEAQAYSRIIQSSSPGGENELREEAVLDPQRSRRVCRSKPSGSVLSDRTQKLQGPSQVASFRLVRARSALFIEWEKAPQCPMGTLHLSLTQRQR